MTGHSTPSTKPNQAANDAGTPTLRIGLVQHACAPDPAANLDNAISLIQQGAARGCQLLVTQELFTSLYFPQVEDHSQFALAQTIPGPTSETLSQTACDLGVNIVASLFEKRAPGVFHNTCVAIDASGRIITRYRKMHIPDDPGFHEKFYFTPGDLGWQVAVLGHAKVGLLICWDQWFPEAARLSALRGAQILLYPSAIGFVPGDDDDQRHQQVLAWKTVHQAHAISNGVFVAAVNRVGDEGLLSFWGRSLVADPSGKIIAQADAHDPTVLIVDCDLSLIDTARQDWPFLRDRRVDAYQGMTARYLEPEQPRR